MSLDSVPLCRRGPHPNVGFSGHNGCIIGVVIVVAPVLLAFVAAVGGPDAVVNDSPAAPGVAVTVSATSTAGTAPLTLDEAWAKARSRSPQLRSAGADVNAAEAAASVAGRWLPDPQLSLSGSTDALTTQEGERDLNAELEQGLRWPMETWARRSGSLSLVDAAEQDRARAEVVAWRELAVAYGSFAAAVDHLALRRSLLDIARRVREAAVARTAAGQSPPIESSFATVDLAAATSALFQAEAAAENARSALCRELVERDCAEVTVIWPSLQVPGLSDSQLLAAVDARPDVAAAAKRAAGARSLRDAAGWQRVPAPTFGFSASQERSELDTRAGTLTDDDTLLGLRVSLPLPVFSLGQGTTAAAAAEHLRSDAQRDAVFLRALHETRAALQAWKQSVLARAAWQQAEPRFEESLRWLAEGYVAGAVDLDAVLTGRDRIARARLESIEARRTEVVAAADALLALGHAPIRATP